jgi:hypothetical protein
MATQLHYLLWGVGVKQSMSLEAGWEKLWRCDALLQELKSVIDLLKENNRTSSHPLVFGENVPIRLHQNYSRDEILAAFDVGNPIRPPQVREGVKWVKEHNIDLFFITLNKSEKDFSPSTMYHDYAISRNRFHWESQSMTTESSPTGQRYIQHETAGGRVALFVRKTKKDSFGRTSAYFCAGLASYVSHVGERPMAITWRLHEQLPAEAFLSYRAAVA